MDLIIVMLDLFERAFKKCREVDIKLNPEKVHLLVDLLICNGTVISTNADEIMSQFDDITARQDFLSSSIGKIGSTWAGIFSKATGDK